MKPYAWVAAFLALAPAASAQGRDGQFYYPGRFNWAFLETYPNAARLFNAFDYGHAILYETLYTDLAGAPAALEDRAFPFLVGDLLRHPPRFEIPEEAILPQYAKIAWRAVQMFRWAHMLHRQIYDAYSDRTLGPTAQSALVERLTDFYLANRRLAFVDEPKAMALMDEQPYSQTFRKRFPKFNGLIWSYHWLQVGLYESLIDEPDSVARRQGIDETLARFWQKLDAPPARMPEVMPMTSAVAPRFSRAHPRAAIIFDNLHMLHDIISDILVSDTVPRGEKGPAIERALDEFQRRGTNVIDREMWLMMSEHLGGVERMGGVAGTRRPRS
jgi:hypothetical protein